MKKGLIALAASLTLSAAVAAHAATTYPDVNGNWAQSDINNLTQQSVMTGFNDNMFHPEAWVTRAEFSNMTLKTLGLAPSQVQQLPSVNNVAQNTYSFGTVDNQAWISAYPSGVFRPQNPVRRVEVLSALAGTINKPMVSDAEATQILSQYNDADQVPANMRVPVATAIKYNLFTNAPQNGSNLNPLQPATRADVAADLNNLWENRDIAVVQNGQVVSSASTTTVPSGTMVSSNQTTTTTTTTTTTGTAQVRGDESTTTTTTMTPNTTDLSSNPYAYNMTTKNTLLNSAVPYRNSADTVQATRFGEAPANIEKISNANLPANTTFTGTVAKALYSEYNRPGDPVVLILDHALIGVDGRIVAPAGSRVLGQVISVLPNNTSGDPAQMALQFSEIDTPSGERVMINGSVANADGMLRADALQGVVVHPQRSTVALSREISTAEGGLYGTKQGKMNVLETPLVTLGSSQPLGGIDQRITPNITVGVGDHMEVKLNGATSTTTTQ